MTSEWGKWGRAQELAQQGQYKEAIEEFLQYSDASAAYDFNLGTLYLAAQNPTLAVAYLERANLKKPFDPSILKNLRAAQQTLLSSRTEEELDPSSFFYERISDQYPLNEALGLFGLFGLLLGLLWIREYRRTHSIRRSITSKSAVFSSSCLLIALILLGAQKLAELHPPAYPLTPSTIRSAPGEHHLSVGQLNPGTRVRLLSKSGDSMGQTWAQIRFSRSQIGWVPESTLLLLPVH